MSQLTGRLLLTVTSDGTNDGILLPANAVESAFGVTLGLRSCDLSFASNVLLLARILPRLAAGYIANSLDESTLG